MSISLTESRRAASPGRAATRVLLSLDRPFAVWQARRSYRAKLRDMPEYLLRDIGLDAHTAHEEASKPFWRR